MTGRTRLRCRFDHTGAQTLAAHFHQAKARNTANLNARTVRLEPVFHPLFNGRIVTSLIHVDKVDHDQTCQVTQTQLACHLVSRFKVGL